VAQTVRVIAVLVTAVDLVDYLRQQVLIRTADMAGVVAIGHGRRDAFAQTDLESDAARQNGAKAGG